MMDKVSAPLSSEKENIELGKTFTFDVLRKIQYREKTIYFLFILLITIQLYTSRVHGNASTLYVLLW